LGEKQVKLRKIVRRNKLNAAAADIASSHKSLAMITSSKTAAAAVYESSDPSACKIGIIAFAPDKCEYGDSHPQVTNTIKFYMPRIIDWAFVSETGVYGSHGLYQVNMQIISNFVYLARKPMKIIANGIFYDYHIYLGYKPRSSVIRDCGSPQRRYRAPTYL